MSRIPDVHVVIQRHRLSARHLLHNAFTFTAMLIFIAIIIVCNGLV